MQTVCWLCPRQLCSQPLVTLWDTAKPAPNHGPPPKMLPSYVSVPDFWRELRIGRRLGIRVRDVILRVSITQLWRMLPVASQALVAKSPETRFFSQAMVMAEALDWQRRRGSKPWWLIWPIAVASVAPIREEMVMRKCISETENDEMFKRLIRMCADGCLRPATRRIPSRTIVGRRRVLTFIPFLAPSSG